MSEEFVPHADWPFPKAEQLENRILRDEIERLTKELFAAKSMRLPQRKPLTVAETNALIDSVDGLGIGRHVMHKVARAIERAHGIGGEYER